MTLSRRHRQMLPLITLICLLPLTALAGDTGEVGLELAQSPPMVMMMVKMIGALALIVGLMALLAIWLRRMGLARRGSSQESMIQLLDSKMIAPKKYVAVVRVGTKTLALGISDQNITMLDQLESDQ